MCGKIQNRVTLMSLLVACLASCSVKEARGPCPCWLQLDLENSIGEELLVSVWSEEFYLTDTFEPESGSYVYEHSVPKGVQKCGVAGGLENSELTGHDLLTVSGCQADPIFASSTEVNADGESVRQKILLHKQYANICLSISRDVSSDFPYKLKVNSNVAGIDLRNMSPVKGEFDYRPQDSGTGEYNFRVLRQMDDSMTVGLIKDGVAIGDLPLGEYIAKSGYDWTAADLEDIYIGIDFIRSEVSVSVCDWETGETFEMKI